MEFRVTGKISVALAVVCMAAGAALAQTTGTSTGTGTSGLTQQQLSLISSLLGGNVSSSALSGLLSSAAGTSSTSGTSSSSGTAATSQPSGSPSTLINGGVTEHQQFYANAFGKTPAQRRAAMSQPAASVKIPIALILPILSQWLAKEIPALGFLANLFGNLTPGTNPGTGPTPPASVSGEGPVAFLTADSTALAVGKTTTARLWVQQSSPNTANDNGIFSVAVNIDATPAGIVQSEVPVSILSGWDKPAVTANTGTATAAGGIDEVTAGVSISATTKDEGISGPVEVFDFTVKAVSAGTVTLTPTNFTDGGFKGVLDRQSVSGTDSNYVPVQITVK